MKKGIKITLSVLAILALFIILAYSFGIGETIFKPFTEDKTLDAIVNKYYFPTTTKTNELAKCTNKNVQYGSSFKFDTNTLPSSASSCMVVFGSTYIVDKTQKNIPGSCAQEAGTRVKFEEDFVYSNLIMLSRDNTYLICQNQIARNNRHNLVTFKTTTAKSCTVKYEQTTNTEKEGKYYCDGKNIVEYPCNRGKKIAIETCELGCEYKDITLDQDGASINVAKCKGDYQPNKAFCSSTGLAYYKTNQQGTIAKEFCSSCSNGICKKAPPAPIIPSCKLLAGTGNNQINMITYNDQDYQDWGFWIVGELEKQTPYNEFTYNLYRESIKLACDKTLQVEMRDTRFGIEDLPGSLRGWGQPGRKGVPGNMIYDINEKNVKWWFLLFHEMGHIYTHAGHSNDGSIMDANGGDSKYRDYQIQKIRYYLNLSDY